MASLDVGDTSTRASSPFPSLPESTTPSAEQSSTPNALSVLQRRSAPSSSTTSEPPTKRRMIRAENTWSEFRDPEGDEPVFDDKKRRLHYCKRCLKWANSVSSNARYHLEKKHHMTVVEGPTPHYKETQRAIDLSFKDQEEKEKQTATEKQQNILRNAISRKAFLEAQCLLITRRRLPRNFVNWPEFHALLYAVNPLSPEVTISAPNTASAYIEKSYQRHRETVKQTLHKSRSLIHFSVDLWSAPSAKSLFGAHAQWVDGQYKLRKALLGLRQITFSHTGENQAAYFMDIVRDFKLVHLVGYFTTDNAGPNDTLLQSLAKNLLVEYGVRINPKKRQIRCLGHIINLSLSAFLFADNKTALEEVLKEAIEEEEGTSVCELLIEKLKTLKGSKGKKNKKKDDFTGWRSIGALGKLHNIAVHIKTSDILSDHWRQLSPNLMLGIDNATRWNSWYLLIKRAVCKRNEIMEICRRYKKDFSDGKDILTEEEWEQLEGSEEFLQPFYQATLEGQKKFASLDQALFFMDVLFKHFEEAKVRDPIFRFKYTHDS